MASRLLVALLVMVVSVFVSVAVCASGADFTRSPAKPLIDFGMLPLGCDEEFNVQFPSVVRAPRWFRPRLGDFYMYFADHQGRYISLAYADDLKGPWTVYAPPTLRLSQVFAVNNLTYNATGLSYKSELSAPDAHVDHRERTVRMYFKHRIPSTGYDIVSAVASSTDGIHFTPRPGFIGEPYVRGFAWRTASANNGTAGRYHYLIDRRGTMLRSPNGYTDWETGNNATGIAFANATIIDQYGDDGTTGYVRHVGLGIVGHTLYIFGSRVGDAPERILWTTMDLDCLGSDWLLCNTTGPAREFMRAEFGYEGAGYPVQPSVKGHAINVNQLRDPYPFFDEDAGVYRLFYTIAGEGGIASARIHDRFFQR